MRRFLQGLIDALLAPLRSRRTRAMTITFLLSAWVSMEAYRQLVVKDLKVAVLDLDNSALSRSFRSLLIADPLVHLEPLHTASLDQARRDLIRGRYGAIVLIPSSFSTDIKRGRTAHVQATTDGANILVAKNIYKSLVHATLAMGVGIGIRKSTFLGVPRRQALSKAMPIEVVAQRTFNPATNYAVYVVPGLVFFLFQIFVILMTAGLFQPRLWPHGPGTRRLGALVGVFLLSMATAALLYGLFLPVEHLVLASSPWIVIGMTASFLVALMLMVVAVHLVAPEAPLAMDIVVFLGMLSLMASGITWPTDVFPSWIAALGQWLPLQPYAQAFQVYLHRDVPFSSLYPEMARLMLQIAVFSVVAFLALSLRRLATRRGGSA